MRFIHPQQLTHLWVLAAAGVIGFIGNEIAARVRLRAGDRLASPALIADGNHARVDGFVSLGVVASAIVVGLGFPRGDPLIGLLISLVILKITWDSWRTVSTTEPGEIQEPHTQPPLIAPPSAAGAGFAHPAGSATHSEERGR
jgi:divalent metal cation (Fe/Co/Zn/Cd) transporter